MSWTFGSGLKCQSKIHLNTQGGGGDWTPFPPLAPGSDGPAEVVVMMTILAVEVLKFKDKLTHVAEYRWFAFVVGHSTKNLKTK